MADIFNLNDNGFNQPSNPYGSPQNIFAPQVEQPVFNPNQFSAPEREDAGFFVNTLETVGSILNVPQQVMYGVGKNIGEFLSGNELTDQGFVDDMIDAVSGRSHLSFNDLLKTVGAEAIDLALPEGYTVDDWKVRVPASLLTGIITGIFTSPFGGIVAGFSMNDILQGKGGVSSIVDIACDPLNKLRIFQKTADGLGIPVEKFAEHVAKGTLDTAKATVKPTGSLLSQLARGERRLFDFKGNSGLFIGGERGATMFPFIKESHDLGKYIGTNILADVLDVGVGLPGRALKAVVKQDDLVKIINRTTDRVTQPLYNTVSKVWSTAFSKGGAVAGIADDGLTQFAEAFGDAILNDDAYIDTIRKANPGLTDEAITKMVIAVKSKENVQLLREAFNEINSLMGQVDARSMEMFTKPFEEGGLIPKTANQRALMNDVVRRRINIDKEQMIAETGLNPEDAEDFIVMNESSARADDITVEQAQDFAKIGEGTVRPVVPTEVALDVNTGLTDKAYAKGRVDEATADEIKRLRTVKDEAVRGHEQIKSDIVKFSDEVKNTETELTKIALESDKTGLYQQLDVAKRNLRASELLQDDFVSQVKRAQNDLDIAVIDQGVDAKALSFHRELKSLEKTRAELNDKIASSMDPNIKKTYQQELNLLNDQKILKDLDFDMNVLKGRLNVIGQGRAQRLTGLSKLEIENLNNLNKYLSDKDVQRIKLMISDKTALGQIDEQTFAVAEGLYTMNRDGVYELSITLGKAGSVDSAFRVIGEMMIRTMGEAKLQQAIKLAGSKEEFVEKFVSLVTSGRITGSPELKGFVAKMGDIWREIMDTVKKVIGTKGFRSDLVEKKLAKWIKGEELLNASHDVLDVVDARKLLDEIGKVLDPYGLKDFLKQRLDRMKSANMLYKNTGIRLGVHGVNWEPLLLADLPAYERLAVQSSGYSARVKTRSNIGTKEAINFQRRVRMDEGMMKTIIDNEILSPQELDMFINAKNLNGFADPGHPVYEAIDKISSAFELVPYEAFDVTPGVLLKGAMNTSKNSAFINVYDYMAENLAYQTNKSASQRLGSFIDSAIGNVYLDVGANEELIKTMRQLKASYPKLKGEIETLISRWNRTGNEAGEEVITQLNPSEFRKLASDTKDFIERNIKDDASIEALADVFENNIQRSQVAGEEMIHAVVSDLKLSGANFEASAIIDNGIGSLTETEQNLFRTKMKERINMQTVDEAVKQKEIADIFETTGVPSRNFTRGRKIDDASKLKGFIEYKAPLGTNDQIQLMFDGKMIPKSFKSMLRTSEEVFSEMSELGKTVNRWVTGVSEEEARQSAQSFLKNKKLLNTPWVENAMTDVIHRTNFDYLQNLWKANALLSPAFHVRNAISAFAVNTQHGVSIGAQIDAFDGYYTAHKRIKVSDVRELIRDKSGDIVDIRLGKGVAITEAQKQNLIYYYGAREQGLVSGGRGAEIIKDSVGNPVDKTTFQKINPLSTQNSLVELNFSAGGVVEDNVRLASYIHGKKVLKYADKEASDFSKLLHFDYNDLSDFEKTYMKRLIPFYTYFRKAIARDSRMFMERTGEFVKMGNLVREAQKGIPPEDSDALNNYIKEQLGVNVGRDANGKSYYLLLGGQIPAADLVSKTIGSLSPEDRFKPTKMVENIAISFIEGLSPFLKEPLQQYLNTDFYFKDKIQDAVNEEASLGGVGIPVRYAHVIKQIRWLKDLDNIGISVGLWKNAVRPEQQQEAGVRALDALGLFSGIKIKQNREPETNKYFNTIQPQRDELKEAQSFLRRAQGQGGVNLPIAQQNLIDLQQKQYNEQFRKEQAREDMKKKIFAPK